MRSRGSCWVDSREPSIHHRRPVGASGCSGGEWAGLLLGHDLGEMVGQSEHAYHELFKLCSRVMLGLRRLSPPVIARVQGIATAAGCQLVASCDLAVAAEKATFATPGVNIGLFCTTPMVPLVQAIPAKAAWKCCLTGAPISAERAAELGLINRVVATDELDAAVKSGPTRSWR